MSVACKCDEGISSLFVGGCNGLVDITARAIFLERFTSTGTRNFLDVSAVPVPASVFTAAFKNVDATKRFHITPELMNPTWVPNEDNLQTFDGGQIAKLSDGTTTLTFMVINVSPQEAANYKKLECGKNDVMLVTESGQLIGYASPEDIDAGRLYGLPVQNITVLATPSKTNASVSNVMITLTLSKTLNLAHIVTVASADMLVDLLTVAEPKNAVLTATTPTTTLVVVNVASEYYGINGALPIEGLGIADFKLTELPSTAVTALTVTETAAGTYSITYAALSSADVLRIELDPASSINYLGNSVEVTIP